MWLCTSCYLQSLLKAVLERGPASAAGPQVGFKESLCYSFKVCVVSRYSSMSQVWKKVARFAGGFISTVTQEKLVQTWCRQPWFSKGQSTSWLPVQKAFVLLQTWVRNAFSWGFSLQHITTVQYDKLNSRRWDFFFLLISGYVIANFLHGRIFQDIQLKYSTLGKVFVLKHV